MDEIRWSPGLMIRLLEIHAQPTEFYDLDRQFIDAGLIEFSGDMKSYVSTLRGQKLIQMWQSTPLPESRWVDPRTGK